jgi:hypothetical protein
MYPEILKLRIKAGRLGTVKEVKQFLTNFENAYNSIYAFVFLIDELLKKDDKRQLKKKYHYLEKYFKEETLLKLIEEIDIDKIILPADEIKISKINIQSPGFWEFLGNINPLEQIRKYLIDRKERRKNRDYRDRIEEGMGNLSIMEIETRIIHDRIKILRELGYSDKEIQQFVERMIIRPLYKLGRHLDTGQIEGIEKIEE